MLNKTLITVCMIGAMLAFPMQTEAQSLSASISVGGGSGQPATSGINVSISLSSNSETDVTGLNFDLSFDSSRISIDNVTIGSAASSAGKALSWSSPSSGKIRVILFGLNQAAISNGTIANLSISVTSSAAPGTFPLSLSNAAATDATGSSVQLSLNSGSFTVNAPPATPTNTSQPRPTNTPTPTNTTAPKTLPTLTPTDTIVPTSTPTATNIPNQGLPSTTPTQKTQQNPTATKLPSSTPKPATTQKTVPTATKTSTQGNLIGSAPTATPTPTPTPTNQPTSSSPSNLENEVGATKEPEYNLDLAVAATGTALASINSQPEATASAMDVANKSTGGGGGLKTIFLNLMDSFPPDLDLVRILILGTGILGAVLLISASFQLIKMNTSKERRR